MFQDVNLLPYLTAYQNVELPLRLGARIDRRRIAEVLDRVGMAHRTDRLPAQLSGGEQARLTARERGARPDGSGAVQRRDRVVDVTDKAVGKHISDIYMKLDLPDVPDHNRRVLAVLKYLQQPE